MYYVCVLFVKAVGLLAGGMFAPRMIVLVPRNHRARVHFVSEAIVAAALILT